MRKNDIDVRAARERLALSTEALAAHLGVTEREVRGWESESLRVPRQARRSLEYLEAHAEWAAGMRASGLPECEWLQAERAKVELPVETEERLRVLNRFTTHMRACEVCTARDRWAKEHLPPFPMPPAGGVIGLALELTQRLPAWARPAAWGALVLASMTAVRALFMLAAKGWQTRAVLEAAGAVLLAGGAGAAGGLAYTLTRPATRRLGTAGDYLSGIIAMASYVGFALAVIPYLGGPRMLGDVAGVVIFVFISVLFGTVVGKMIHDGERLKKAME